MVEGPPPMSQKEICLIKIKRGEIRIVHIQHYPKSGTHSCRISYPTEIIMKVEIRKTCPENAASWQWFGNSEDEDKNKGNFVIWIEQ